MKWINYHHLIYFREIATHGSMARASEKLKIGQPALSAQLKDLEEYLGVQLFERKNRRLVITQAGTRVLEYATRIHDLGQELLSVVDGQEVKTRTHLTIGAIDNIPKTLLFDLAHFAQKQTKCTVRVEEGSIENLMRMLSAHQIDLIVADHTVSSLDIKTVFCKRIQHLPVAAYSDAVFSHLKGNFPHSLHKVPVILPTIHAKFRSDLEHFFVTQKITPDIIAETQDTALQKIYANKGVGVIFLPEFAAKEFVREEMFIKLGRLPNVFVEYFLISTKKVIKNPAIEALLDLDYSNFKL